MVIQFAYSKLKTAQERYFSPASPITTWVESGEASFHPLGGSGSNAPSTLILDGKGNQFYVSKAFSTVNEALTAVTSASDSISIL